MFERARVTLLSEPSDDTASRGRVGVRTWMLLCGLALLCGCKTDTKQPVLRCPKRLFPCGKGCIPANAVCCDDGSGKTSSYCTNAAGGGCRQNTAGCPAAFPRGAAGKFCCDHTGSLGSNDCPAGQEHCGELCLPRGKSCCPEGSSIDACPLATADEQCGSGRDQPVTPCGTCRNIPFCVVCPAGTCCQGDPRFDGKLCTPLFKCVSGPDVCPGIRGGGSKSDGAVGSCPGGWIGSTRTCMPLGGGGSCSCSGSGSTCITKKQYEQTGHPFPPACAAEGTTDCLDNTNALVKPCCPGLTCAAGKACGQEGSGFIGKCIKR